MLPVQAPHCLPPTDSCDRGVTKAAQRSVCSYTAATSTATVVSARHLWPVFHTKSTERVILKEGPCISYDLQGICSGMNFLASSCSQWGSLRHCLKPQHTQSASHLTYYNRVPNPAVVSTIVLPPLFCLTEPYTACWLDFSSFSIFRRNYTRKNTLEGQSGKTGRSQMALVVIDWLQCHDNSQQLSWGPAPLNFITVNIMLHFNAYLLDSHLSPSFNSEALI